ncbi:MAG: (p)ppGpp synthetase [Pseudomonadota bacterium]|nr:(p)ppGpp synthetase [Pseudomonadota bacterium]
MPSLDFEAEKAQFRDFHTSSHPLLEDAKDSFVALINALLIHAGSIAISKIEGRVKDREECIKKFNLKYRTNLESSSTPYTIRDHISDLIGLRVVCLYEDDIENIEKCLSEHFEVIEKTDKIAQIENTEGSFGYKGLHLDLRLNQTRKALPEYSKYSEFKFEVQTRTIIQDSWSVLDHKIKYKKSIPTRLKRRINTLAALFELADREFREIRDSTVEEIEKEEISDEVLQQETDESQSQAEQEKFNFSILNAFSFLKISNHFFSGFEFEPHKVDGFTQEIIGLKPGISRGKFNYYMRENISRVKRYQSWFEKSNQNDKLNPYTIIRHCIYLGDKEAFTSILTNVAKESFEHWLKDNG